MGHDCEENECCCASVEDQMEKGDYLNELADEAWSELMKEKIKKVLEKTNGERMNKTAQVIADARYSYWMNKMKAKAEQEAWEEKIQKSMME